MITDSGGDVDIIVASEQEVKISAIREAFQFVFGKATITYVFNYFIIFLCTRIP